VRSGFSLIKNGEKRGDPYRESLMSLAPLVDEIVVAVGDNEDSTKEELIKLAPQLPCPLILIDSPWDAQNNKGGLELSRQSNIALSHCRHEICIYIQADEVLHEDDYPLFRRDLERFEKDDDVDALAFHWIHFYGDFNTFVHSRQWYRREIRAIKKSRGLKSYGDAQGFRILNGQNWSKPRAALSKARYLHYGWVRPPQVMAQKSEALDRLWHGHENDGKHKPENVYPSIYGMKPFRGSHPKCMQTRIASYGKDSPLEGKSPIKNTRYWRLWADHLIEKLTGWRPGEYTNYKSLKKY
jgi:glycosyltransferase involved in cell wall biosynthesis